MLNFVTKNALKGIKNSNSVVESQTNIITVSIVKQKIQSVTIVSGMSIKFFVNNLKINWVVEKFLNYIFKILNKKLCNQEIN
jgi:hypothetical protein